MEALISSMIADGLVENRPPHMRLLIGSYLQGSWMNETSPRGRSVPALVVGAAVVGLAIGLAGVYVTGWLAGNGASGDAHCTEAAATADRLAPFARGEVAALIPAETPVDLSTLAFIGEDGAPTTLASYAGKSVLLNLWATWCVPCREEMPALDRLQKARGGERFQVVTVNIDVGDPAKPAAFLEAENIVNLPDHRDPRMAIFNELKSRSLAFGMPTTILVDPAGCQVAALHGPAEWDSPDALAVVDALAGGS
jgi:thiol-disulfide isomerase/thioredoxin